MDEQFPTPAGFDALDACVHCGFCLPACPTYLVTGDEADSPRGRILLMRALERGELRPTDAGLNQHLDACLGCRACEPACPSGVGYGLGLAAAREQLAAARGWTGLESLLLGLFKRERIWRPLMRASRLVRGTGLPDLFSGNGTLAFACGMLAATRDGDGWSAKLPPAANCHCRGAQALPPSPRPGAGAPTQAARSAPPPSLTATPRATVALFRGCVMDELFGHVHDATKRVLEVNGYEVVEVRNQVCCGALHEHAGDRRNAQRLAAQNVAAFALAADLICVNSAGCGATLKEYHHLLEDDLSELVASKVRDVSELLADAGPLAGAPLPLDVAYDPPCHLQHAQRVHAQPLALLQSIPGLRLHLLPGHDQCCGSAGIYSLTNGAMARDVLRAKLDAIEAADPRPDLLVTGNPGCIMQLGAGMRTANLPIPVRHTIELLDESYRRAGYYA